MGDQREYFKNAHFPQLLAPGRIGSVTVRNRIVMSPMDDNMADRDGHVTDQKIAWYARRAEGGAGLVLTGNAYVTLRGRSFSYFQLGIDSDDKLPGLERLAAAIHAHGARAGVQLAHAGRQTTRSQTGGLPPEAPSPLPEPLFREMPEELTQARMAEIAELFAQGALRAKRAGFDLVEVHGAHGQLQHLFLSPLTNVRSDEHGGPLANRARFSLDTVRAIRRAVGPDFPIGYRISCEDLQPGGLSQAEMLDVAGWLAEAGVDYLHASVGIGGSYPAARMILAPPGIGPAHLEHYARAVRERVTVPVITVGRHPGPETAERALAAGSADFVAFGRALIADPDLPAKAAAGTAAAIRPCTACEQGCIDRWLSSLDVTCTVNPEAGRELRPPGRPGPRQAVVVVGGGPAGLEAAAVAAEHGHDVVLLEAGDRLGGQLALAARTPHQAEWGEYLEWQERRVRALGIDVRLGVRATAGLVAAEQPALAVVASGAVPMEAHSVPGWDLPHVADMFALLAGRVEAGPRVAVVGSSLAACRTALLLADHGHEVTVVADLVRGADGLLAHDIAGPVVRPMVEEWVRERTTVLAGRLPKRVVPGGLVLDAAGLVPPHLGEARVGPVDESLLEVDTVVLGTRRRSDARLAAELRADGRIPRIVVVGDAVEPRSVLQATAEGAAAAWELPVATELRG